jgi:hypothetical protein
MTASQNYEKVKIFLNCEHDFRYCDDSTLSKIEDRTSEKGNAQKEAVDEIEGNRIPRK